ncbi:MAG TPA: hypothetical protein ENI79_02300 [Rhodospirillales bacterium]|nr:hypothetical protein [Rhodospirillales bacterium]
MAKPAIDISLLGDKAIEKRLAKLPERIQRKAVRQTMRATLKNVHKRLDRNLSGGLLQEDSGAYRRAMRAQKIKSGKRSRSRLTLGVALPTREEMGIDPKDTHYYPAVLEYGAPGHQAYAPIRRAVDDYAADDRKFMAADLAKRITKEMLVGAK